MKACYKKLECPICGQLINKPNMTKHMRKHEHNPGKHLHKIRSTNICPFCERVFTTNSGCGIHIIYCLQNPDRIISGKKGSIPWNKGLTKETDERVAMRAIKDSNSKRGKPGHKHSQETKLKISERRKEYLNNHPDKIPFKLNHSSKESYPEKYFRKWLKKINLLDKQEFQVSRYTLDFAWPDRKIYLEIDGNQHKLDWMVEHDRVRTEFLSELGWCCVQRVDWEQYQKLNKREKHNYLMDLKNKLLNELN